MFHFVSISRLQLYDELSPLWSQACEDDCRLEGLNIKGLAALTADIVIHNIHNRLAERPAGTDMCSHQEMQCIFSQLEGHSTSPAYFCFFNVLFFPPSDHVIESGTPKNMLSVIIMHSSLFEVFLMFPLSCLTVTRCFFYCIFLEVGRRSFFVFVGK